MRVKLILSAVSGVAVLAVTLVAQQAGQAAGGQGQPAGRAQEPPPDDVRTTGRRVSSSKNSRPRSRASRSSAIAAKARSAIATPSIGSRRSSRASAVRPDD